MSVIVWSGTTRQVGQIDVVLGMSLNVVDSDGEIFLQAQRIGPKDRPIALEQHLKDPDDGADKS